MNYKLSYVFFLILMLTSCKNEDQKQLLENQKETKKRELLFSKINKDWVFHDTPINTTSEASVANWNEWRMFLAELAQKPKKTIVAFQLKTKELSKKAMALNDNIPAEFNKPQIKSRISTLITKVRLLDLFIHLDAIPDKKVKVLVSEINTELVSLQRQMDKIVEKSKIPVEEGESDLMKMLDTTRAIPNTPIDPNLPRVE
jgi:membrane-bound lytic murein transglycosylase